MARKAKTKVKVKPARPIKQPLHPWVYGLACLIAVGIAAGLLAFFKPKGTDRAVLFIIYGLTAFSASASLFGFMRSYAWKKTEKNGGKGKSKRMRTMTEWGGPVVLFIPLLLLGLNWGAPAAPFDFTVFLRDAGGTAVLTSEGKLKIQLDREIKTGAPDENGAVDFKNIPAKFREGEVTIELAAVGWQFANGKNTRPLVLKENNATLIIQPDDSLCCISGTVTDSEGRFIAGAEVVVKGIACTTGEYGRFSLRIPPGKQEKELKLTVQKQGYETRTTTAHPLDRSDIEIVLVKKGEGE